MVKQIFPIQKRYTVFAANPFQFHRLIIAPYLVVQNRDRRKEKVSTDSWTERRKEEETRLVYLRTRNGSPVPRLFFFPPLLFLLSFFLFLAKHDPAQRFVELYAMTYNLDTISHAISMQSRKGVPFCKWFHLDEEFIG